MSAHPVVFEDSIKIAAPRKKVWSVIVCGREDEKSSCPWVAAPDGGGFFFQGGWREGGEVKMFGPDESGAVVRVSDFALNARLKYEQIAALDKGRRDDSESEWRGVSDEFNLSEYSEGGDVAGTVLTVTARYPESCRESLSQEFRRSMKKIKELSETEARGGN